MKNIKIFNGLLLTSTVVWTVLSSPLSAVSLEAVRTYWLKYRTIESFDPQALDKLTMLDETQWKKFKELVRSFIPGRTDTQYLEEEVRDQEILNRARKILALKDLPPEILFHDKFSNGLLAFFLLENRHYNIIPIIEEIQKHRKHFTENFSIYDFFQALGDEKSTLKDNPIVKALKSAPRERIDNPKFWGIFNPALTMNNDRYVYNSAFLALTNLDDIIFSHQEFPDGITTFLKMFDTEDNLQYAIDDIGSKVSLFKIKFSYYELFQALGDYRHIKELKKLPQNLIDHPEFWKTLHQLVSEG